MTVISEFRLACEKIVSSQDVRMIIESEKEGKGRGREEGGQSNSGESLSKKEKERQLLRPQREATTKSTQAQKEKKRP